MLPEPVHPMIVHIPIALAALMPVIAGALLLAWWRAWLPRRAWLVAVALQAVLAGGGWAALQSGEHDEERVEAVAPHAAIEAHEDAAVAIVAATGVTLALLLLASLIRAEAIARRVALVGVVGTLVVAALGVRTGSAGGALVYEHGAASVWARSPPADAHRDQHDDDD